MTGRTERESGAGRGAGSGLSTSIEIDDVEVQLNGRRVLHDVSVRLDQRRIAVIGANGSGKSTFARLLNGLVAPSRGRVVVHGIDVARDRRAVRDRVGFVFTHPDAQILMPTVVEDVSLSLRGLGLSRAAIAERVSAVLGEYGLSGHADAPAYSLSGGQKQLLALAAVLVREPQLVVADEPTTLLDLGNARRISDLLVDRLAAQTIIVTHDLDLARRCEIALLFDAGRLTAVDEPGAVVERYRRQQA
ncbi:energy-coupling factor ABC transporter ATP-binding protein [Microbacterium sp. 18062]|uniref:energy-coupling factor ABC transporter ATP-binding protein n=1 Tax=Microbacterium sp. 18062 TaxID=2681410 RepID=UPI0027D2967A|nr:ABC transporter ATP-binding protein [Microbacterium sp. 18062]